MFIGESICDKMCDHINEISTILPTIDVGAEVWLSVGMPVYASITNDIWFLIAINI